MILIFINSPASGRAGSFLFFGNNGGRGGGRKHRKPKFTGGKVFFIRLLVLLSFNVR
jgi:hypothetical protein